jgi:hypothetical protein
MMEILNYSIRGGMWTPFTSEYEENDIQEYGNDEEYDHEAEEFENEVEDSMEESENDIDSEELDYPDESDSELEELPAQRRSLTYNSRAFRTTDQLQLQETRPLKKAKSNTSSVSFPLDEADTQNVKDCCICMENDSCTVIVDCGHAVTCNKCIRKLTECPICRKKMTHVIKLYK